MSKAFDFFTRDKQIENLRFLVGSTQYEIIFHQPTGISVDGYNGISMHVIRGCPQGLSYAQILWNIFRNDMIYIINNSNPSMHGDDHQFYTMKKSIQCIEQSLDNGGQIII